MAKSHHNEPTKYKTPYQNALIRISKEFPEYKAYVVQYNVRKSPERIQK